MKKEKQTPSEKAKIKEIKNQEKREDKQVFKSFEEMKKKFNKALIEENKN